MRRLRTRVLVIALGIALGLIIAGAAVMFGWSVGPALLRALTLVLTSATIAYLIMPLAQLYEKRFTKGMAAGLAMLSILFALASLIALGIPSFAKQLTSLIDAMPEYVGVIENLLDYLVGVAASAGMGDVFGRLNGQLSAALQAVVGAVGGWAVTVPGAVANAVLALLLGFYFVKDRAFFYERLSMMIPRKHRSAALGAGRAVRDVLRSYVRGQITVSFITGALTGVACALLGIPGFLVLGVFMAIFDLIPYIGPFIGAVPIVIIAFSVGWGKLIAAVVAVIIIQEFEALILSPRIVGERSGLHPAVVVLALFIGGELLGVAGMLFAVPVTVSVRAIVQSILHRRLYPPDAEEEAPRQ